MSAEVLSTTYKANPAVVSHIQQTTQHRLKALLKSDTSLIWNGSEGGRSKSLPTFLPPKYPQQDRSVSASLLNATFIAPPPPYQFLSKDPR
jgi:hypothetical protein